MFAFDGLFTDEDAQSEVAASALSEAIHGVISGVDSCLFAFGHASLGKPKNPHLLENFWRENSNTGVFG